MSKVCVSVLYIPAMQSFLQEAVSLCRQKTPQVTRKRGTGGAVLGLWVVGQSELLLLDPGEQGAFQAAGMGWG